MSVVLWGVLALAGGFVALWIAARMARPTAAPLPANTEFPPTPMQKVARWSIGIGALLAATAAALVVANGARATFESDTLRLTFTLILVAVLGVVGAATVWLRRQVTREDGLLDERDRTILGRAPAAQAIGMVVTLAIWTVGLAEHFHDAGAVPVFYLYLVFWSCVVVDLLALPVGILLGYRRS